MFEPGAPYPDPATWTHDEEHYTVSPLPCPGLLACSSKLPPLHKYVDRNQSTRTISGKLRFTKTSPPPLTVISLSLRIPNTSGAAVCVRCKPGLTLLKSADVVQVCSPFLERRTLSSIYNILPCERNSLKTPFTFSASASGKETKMPINYPQNHLPVQWQEIACSPRFAATPTQSWSPAALLVNATAHPL